jgi:hypothetical protein
VTDPTALAVEDQLDDDNRLTLKHGIQLLAIADYSEAVPDAWYESDETSGLMIPKVLPAGYRNMGYITTDGQVFSTAVTSDDVMAVQDTSPIRSDRSQETETFKVKFLEAGNGYVQALRANQPVSAWPATKYAGFEMHRGESTATNYYRALVLTQDGSLASGTPIFTTVFAYRVSVTDYDDTTLNRSNAEEVGFTFTAYKDPVVKRSITRAQTAAYPTPSA